MSTVSTSPLTVVHSFSLTDGAWSRGSLTLSTIPTLQTGVPTLMYGRTSLGGGNNSGTIFSFETAPSPSPFTLLWSFPDGLMMPHHNAMPIVNNNSETETLYGAALYGGIFPVPPNPAIAFPPVLIPVPYQEPSLPTPPIQTPFPAIGYGGLFSLTATPGTIAKNAPAYAINYKFSNGTNDGATPHSPFSLLSSTATTIYGMTAAGGTAGQGVLYRFPFPFVAAPVITILESFSSGSALNEPHGMVVADPNQNTQQQTTLYGMTRKGGSAGFGGIFSYNLSTNAFSDIHDFAGGATDGATNDHGYLCMIQSTQDGDSITTFYGVTSKCGTYGGGTLFSFTSTNGTYTPGSYATIYNFGGNLPNGVMDGSTPFGSLIVVVVNGILYGTTKLGGAGNYGTIFSWNTTVSTSQYSSLASFDLATTGAYPEDCLTANSAQTVLYGLTQAGGANDPTGEGYYGTVFAYTI